MRINKYIAHAAWLMSQGRRTDQARPGDGQCQVVREFIIKTGDQVEAEGPTHNEEKAHYLLNKPRGVILVYLMDKHRTTVVDLLFKCQSVLYPVDVLDWDTSGV